MGGGVGGRIGEPGDFGGGGGGVMGVFILNTHAPTGDEMGHSHRRLFRPRLFVLLNRRKEPLEAFPLDSMALVGNLSPKGKSVALVKVDNLLYQVKVGSYLGQNYGKVTKVSETEVTLREIVQDAAGEWIERQANLQLQERSK